MLAIQSHWRSYVQQQEYQWQLGVIVSIQIAWRSVLARRNIRTYGSRHLTQTHINSMLQLHSLPKMRKHRKDQPHVIAQVVKAARIKAFAQREEWEKIRENYSLL